MKLGIQLWAYVTGRHGKGMVRVEGGSDLSPTVKSSPELESPVPSFPGAEPKPLLSPAEPSRPSNPNDHTVLAQIEQLREEMRKVKELTKKHLSKGAKANSKSSDKRKRGEK